jgi:hypothetical protein
MAERFRNEGLWPLEILVAVFGQQRVFVLQRFSDACDLKYFISAIFHIIQRFPDARSFSIARLLKLKLELSTLDARR